MKQIITICAVLLMTASVLLPQQVNAQSPEKMSYQAVIRDGSNTLLVSTAVGMQISILQGGATGTAVYVETQTPTTNANGLVSVEIGAGTVQSGDFTTIDWANGTYFIKTETDPTGGTTYTITGTSQLLSVPYALHAKTAQNITGTVNYTETDPIFGASTANGITAADITNWNNHTVDTDTQLDSTGVAGLGFVAGAHTIDTDTHIDSTGVVGLGFVAGAHTIDTDTHIDSTGVVGLGFVAGAHTVVTAGTNTTVTGAGTTASPYVVNASGVTTYSVGDFAQGGIVFWVDETGQHGLVCAKEDQSTGVRWYAGANTSTMAKGDGPYSGELNTAIIIANQGNGDGSTYAARICNELQITEGGKTYGNWYLPSIEELRLMNQNKATINTTAAANSGSNFAIATYWSSTELSINNAWYYYFLDGTSRWPTKDNTYRVRAVRAF